MGNYETITLRSHRFDKIIEVLEKTGERSEETPNQNSYRDGK